MNRISHNKKAIFCHIPKCGGTSTEKIISNWIRINHKNPNILNSEKFIGTGGYLFLNYRDILEKYYIFTITRNPYDRFISGFLDVNKTYLRRGLKDLEFFKKNYNKLNINNQKNSLLKYHIEEHFLRTQTEILGELYPFIDDFFKLERKNELLKKLNSFGMNSKELPKARITKMMNKDQRKNWISKEIKSYIDEKYHEDFINFGYSKKL